MTTGRINQVITKPTQTSAQEYLMNGWQAKQNPTTGHFQFQQQLKPQMPSSRVWLRNGSEASYSKKQLCSKLILTKAEYQDSSEVNQRNATEYSKPLLVPIKCYSLSSSQPRIPNSHWHPEGPRDSSKCQNSSFAFQLNSRRMGRQRTDNHSWPNFITGQVEHRINPRAGRRERTGKPPPTKEGLRVIPKKGRSQ